MRLLGGWAEFSEVGMALRVYYQHHTVSLLSVQKVGRTEAACCCGTPSDGK